MMHYTLPQIEMHLTAILKREQQRIEMESAATAAASFAASATKAIAGGGVVEG